MLFRVHLVLVCVLMIGLSFIVSAQSEKIIKTSTITCKMSFNGAPSLPDTGGIPVVNSSAMKWLTALITYTPTLDYEKSQTGAKTRVRWLDELTVTMYILIPSIYGNRALLSGKQILWSVPCDGKVHRVFFAVPPQILNRYGTIEKINKNTASTIPAIVEFRNKNQVVLARYLYTPKGEKPQNIVNIFSRIMGSNIGFLKLTDALLPKERTPWNLVEVDAFDLSKSSVEGK